MLALMSTMATRLKPSSEIRNRTFHKPTWLGEVTGRVNEGVSIINLSPNHSSEHFTRASCRQTCNVHQQA